MIEAESRQPVLDLAHSCGVELVTVDRWNARMRHGAALVSTSSIPVSAVATSLARVMLEWDAELAAGRTLPQMPFAKGQISALEQLLSLEGAGYFARTFGAQIATDALGDLMGLHGEQFGTNPGVDSPTHELLSVLLADTLKTDITGHDRENQFKQLLELGRTAMRSAHLVDLAHLESGNRVQRAALNPKRRVRQSLPAHRHEPHSRSF